MTTREPGLYEITNQLGAVFYRKWHRGDWFTVDGVLSVVLDTDTIRGPLVVASAPPCTSLARLLDENYSGVLTAAQRKQIVEWAAPGYSAAADAWDAVCQELASHGWHEWSRGKTVSGMASACEFIRHLAEKMPEPAAPLGVEEAKRKAIEIVSAGGGRTWRERVDEIFELFSRVPAACPECEPGKCPTCGSDDDTMLAWLKSAKDRAMSDHRYSDAALLRDVEYRLKTLLASRPSPEVVHGGEGVTLREGVWVVFHKGTRYGADYGGFAAIDPEFSYVRVSDIPPAPEPPKPVLPSGSPPRRFIARIRDEAHYGFAVGDDCRLCVGGRLASLGEAEALGWQIEWLDPEGEKEEGK